MNDEQEKRWKKAYELHKDGKSQRAIATGAGVSTKSIPKIIKWGDGNQKEIMEISLTPPPPPKSKPRAKKGIERESKGNHGNQSDEDMWNNYKPNQKPIPIPTHIPEAVFTACAFYEQTRGKRAKNAKKPQTSSELGNIREIGRWGPYIKWQQENFGKELKSKIKPGVKPSDLNGDKK